MKKKTILTVPVVMLCILFMASCFNADAQRRLQKKMIGTWQVCNEDSTLATKLSNMEDLSRYKVITKESFSVMHFGKQNKQVYGAFYGTYSLKKKVYTEKVMYTNYGDVMGAENSFKVKVNKDYMFLTGINNDWSEIWKKVKD